ncbi:MULTISPECIES: Msa family membrane protein [Staphylococcus]|nr:Msa family membrane protein [Staphylococcus capitis]OAO26484.1 hypothetical protein AXY38_06785 [Staphylococcus capitis]OAO30507.1 hypothetical protein AXY39_00445 [Staphylococcus capitis]PTG24910.1 hypothetical protein BU628_10080 [Staphylococcus capitis]PTG29000.1 hypothetical protein BU630_11850 [Staphylococcus capitis]PTG35721.1 hypothetical protein BU624_11950 [Staphylococcus capitis]
MKSILLSLFLNFTFFSILALLELHIDVYLANLLIILIPTITSTILIFFTSKMKLFLSLNVILNLFYYIIYSIYIMHLDGYLSYIDRAQITSSDIEIKISPNMLELSQIIFLFFVYLMPQLIVVFIKHKRGENNARI